GGAGGAHIFDRALGHETDLVRGPVIADLSQRTVDRGVIARIRKSKAGVPAGMDIAKAVHCRECPGPGTFVDGAVEADLGQVQRRRLERQGHVDIGVALVDGEADIDAGRQPRAEAGAPAIGLALVTDEVALRLSAGRDAVALEPGPVARRLDLLGSTAASGIAAERT